VSEITRSPDHQYTFQGVTYPGVTGILKIIDKSGPLMSWAARMTAEAAIAALPSLPSLLDTVGPEGVVKALTARSAWKNEEARDLGTEVHRLADMLVTGQALPAMEPATLKRVDAYEAWWRTSGWSLRSSEAYLVNTRLGYGGTLDLLCRDRDGKTVLADIKTGKGVYAETALQLTAYGMAEWIDAPGLGLFPMPVVDRYCVVHVMADQVREVEMVVDDLARRAWAGAMDLAAWRDSTKGQRL
jgi:hypothetical protein